MIKRNVYKIIFVDCVSRTQGHELRKKRLTNNVVDNMEYGVYLYDYSPFIYFPLLNLHIHLSNNPLQKILASYHDIFHIIPYQEYDNSISFH